MSLSDEHGGALVGPRRVWRTWATSNSHGGALVGPRLRRMIEKHFEAVQLKLIGLKPNGKRAPLDKISLTDDDVAICLYQLSFQPKRPVM
jgi:hypothetical protein